MDASIMPKILLNSMWRLICASGVKFLHFHSNPAFTKYVFVLYYKVDCKISLRDSNERRYLGFLPFLNNCARNKFHGRNAQTDMQLMAFGTFLLGA